MSANKSKNSHTEAIRQSGSDPELDSLASRAAVSFLDSGYGSVADAQGSVASCHAVSALDPGHTIEASAQEHVASYKSVPASSSESGFEAAIRQQTERPAAKILHRIDKEVPYEAKERFQDLQELFFEPLCNYAFKSAKRSEHMSWQLKWLEEDTSNSKLHIVIACHKKYIKKVKKFFKQPHIKNELERTDTYFQPAIVVCEGPWLLAGPMLGSDVYLNNSATDSLCGLAIITRNEEIFRQAATLGGTIACTSSDGTFQVWGLSIGHVFHAQHSVMEDSDTSELTDDSDDAIEDDTEVFEVVISPRASHRNLQSEAAPTTALNLEEKTWDPDNVDMAPLSLMTPDPQCQGRDCCLDWSFVQLSDNPRFAHKLSNHALGRHQIIKTLSPNVNEDQLVTESAASSQRVSVLVTSDDGGQDLLAGNLSFDPSFISLGHGNFPVMAFSFKPSDQSKQCLVKGHCGAWVVHTTNYSVYGHVVALDPFGDALVIPMKDIFKDIETSLGVKDVGLYDRETIHFWKPKTNDSNGKILKLSNESAAAVRNTAHADIVKMSNQTDYDEEEKQTTEEPAPAADIYVLLGTLKESKKQATSIYENTSEEQYYQRFKFWRDNLVTIAIFTSVCFASLDFSILTPAIPMITDEFNALDSIGWYAFASHPILFMLVPMWTRLFSNLSVKWTFIAALGIVQSGNLVCCLATNFTFLIIGRVICNIGLAGIFRGNTVISMHMLHFREKPGLSKLMNILFYTMYIAGMFLGGAFANNTSWRWCFYICFPFMGFTSLVIIFFFRPPQLDASTQTRGYKILQQVDLFSISVLASGMICMGLALQWGGGTYAWGNWRVILLLFLFGLLITLFIFLQFRNGEYATVPLRMIRKRTLVAGALCDACCYGAYSVVIFYSPIWFQAVYGASVIKSVIMCLPLITSCLVSKAISPTIVSAIGYRAPIIFASSTLISVGAGLLATVHVDARRAALAGYQILLGTGAGVMLEEAIFAAVSMMPSKDVTLASSIVMFVRGIGSAAGLAISGVIFRRKLISNIRSRVPDVDVNLVISAGATTFRHRVPEKDVASVLVAFDSALKKTFFIASAMAATSIIGVILMEWKSVKAKVG
ncbi:MAG: hypothetical protein M1822_004479 [Bathelium mastoideum]|nr:MAG: hypothetical protein M1822_004479 [Bathelium mastoideum]